MHIGQIMTRKVISAKPDTLLSDAFNEMLTAGVNHLPVMEKTKIVGIISDRDLRGCITPSKKNSKKVEIPPMLVSEIMTKDVITADPAMSVYDAVRMMLRLKIGALPVLEKGKLRGIVTKHDLLDVFAQMLGMIQDTSAIDVELVDEVEDCTTVFSVLKNHRAAVVSYSSVPSGKKHNQVCHFRLQVCPVKPIIQELEKRGVKVLDAYGEDT